ncbi:gp338 [Bacillus phage G]|uniref:Gp338 n=1 Tax=Bacillus phage G TaxID=2884420 RepID=G3MA79_9CAUD|nr:gp338 [Bacillus phage G]AEO93597.1 gp338 [Bacillus phage G]
MVYLKRNSLDVISNDREIKIFINNEKEFLHKGRWKGAITQNMFNEPINLIGHINWGVEDNVLDIDKLEIREEYKNTNVLLILVNEFKNKIIRPMLKKHGKGNVFLITGFQNKKLRYLVERSMPKLGLKWHSSVTEKMLNNYATLDLINALKAEKAGIIGSLVVANFPVKKYRELYINYLKEDIPNNYWLPTVDNNGDIWYSPLDRDSISYNKNNCISFYDDKEIFLEEIDKEFLDIYKNNPTKLLENMRKIIGEDGIISFDEYNPELSKTMNISDKESIDNHLRNYKIKAEN